MSFFTVRAGSSYVRLPFLLLVVVVVWCCCGSLLPPKHQSSALFWGRSTSVLGAVAVFAVVVAIVTLVRRYHAVSEVRAPLPRQRISIQGWYHGASAVAPLHALPSLAVIKALAAVQWAGEPHAAAAGDTSGGDGGGASSGGSSSGGGDGGGGGGGSSGGGTADDATAAAAGAVEATPAQITPLYLKRGIQAQIVQQLLSTKSMKLNNFLVNPPKLPQTAEEASWSACCFTSS